MWVFTQDGYVSAVESSRDPQKLAVRARDAASLELLSAITGAPIVEIAGSDYEYRVFVSRDEFASWLVSHADNVDYRNFKSRIAATRGDTYHDACMDVWTAMLQVADSKPSKF